MCVYIYIYMLLDKLRDADAMVFMLCVLNLDVQSHPNTCVQSYGGILRYCVS